MVTGNIRLLKILVSLKIINDRKFHSSIDLIEKVSNRCVYLANGRCRIDMVRTLHLQGVRVGKKNGASSVSRYKLVKNLQLLCLTVNLLTADE